MTKLTLDDKAHLLHAALAAGARAARQAPAQQGLAAAADDTRELPAVGAEPGERLQALARASFRSQLAALLRGEYTATEWRSIRTPDERLELLCGLCEDEQLDALRARCFSLDEWCAFARRHPQRVFMLGGEFAFIAITTPEWCER